MALHATVSVATTDELFKTRPQLNECFKFIAGEKQRIQIGRVASFTSAEAVEAIEAACKAWDNGQGHWPQMSLACRISAIEHFLDLLQPSRNVIIDAVMWEICKNAADAASEFDRTVAFIRAVISKLKASDDWERLGTWTTIAGTRGRMRRGPIGVALMLAPFNYPLNEMYAMMIPALLMGNTIVLKLPAVGGLAHILTVDALSKALPAGVVNFVTGSGRKTMKPIMATGLVDAIGFIGSAKAADALIKDHPQPHRLRVFAQLEAKNMAIVLPDADLDVATKQILLGSLSYNGQRCTACKLIMAHASILEALTEKIIDEIKGLKKGLPQDGAHITPLPEPDKLGYLKDLVQDAVSKGALIRNAGDGGGKRIGNLLIPAVLLPVTPSMRLFHEEQFGPVVPIASFNDISEVIRAAKTSWSGQQVAIFTKDKSGSAATPLVDALSSIVGRINLNAQCSRGPDMFPFSGRRSSAMGTLSVVEALHAFSVEVLLAYPDNDDNRAVAAGVQSKARFLQPISAL